MFILNIVLAENSQIDALFSFLIISPVSLFRSAVRYCFDLAHHISLVVLVAGSGLLAALLLAVLITLLITAFVVGLMIRKHPLESASTWMPPPWLLLLFPTLLCSLFMIFYFSQVLENSPAFGEDDSQPPPEIRGSLVFTQQHSELIRFSSLIFGFLAFIWYDMRRTHRIDLRGIAFELARATPFVVSTFPLISVLLGMGFMILLWIFDLASMDTKVLNSPIYYGLLYGPFLTYHFQVKRQLRRAPTLPL
jgi:hypothetical protein